MKGSSLSGHERVEIQREVSLRASLLSSPHRLARRTLKRTNTYPGVAQESPLGEEEDGSGSTNIIALDAAGVSAHTSPNGKKDIREESSRTFAALSRKGSNLVRRSKDSVGSLLKFSDADSERSSSPRTSFQASETTDYPESPTKSTLRPALGSFRTLSRRSATTSATAQSEKDTTPEILLKDSLKTVFANLDGECQKFLSKPVAVRTSVVRSCLHILLEKHTLNIHDEPLPRECLQQRCLILNKWWHALLDTLRAGNDGSLNLADRHTIYTAITGIVERSEWKARLSIEPEPAITHTIYMQLRYVVDKLSCRNKPDSSLVSLAGKFTALAWFLCPGIADILVRLWKLPWSTLKRPTSAMRGSESGQKPSHDGMGLYNLYPTHLSSLNFRSPRAYATFMRDTPEKPIQLETVGWHHPHWLAKWTGRESALFSEFLEAFYTIVADISSPSASNFDRLHVPGVALVNAQMLTVLESLVARSQMVNIPEPTSGPSSLDYLARIDAAATALPITPVSMQRPIEETILVRSFCEFLQRNDPAKIVARHLFAEAFAAVQKASCKRISVFDQSACFTLCDLLQEIVPVIAQFRRDASIGDSIIDWDFWLDVCKLMLKSESTSTEIRVYILLYSIWPTVAASKKMKQHVCGDMLLNEGLFFSRFNHWCPMVRTYYMRLLCWRVGRLGGEATDWELRICELLQSRLRMIYSHYHHYLRSAEAEHRQPLSIEPCNPVPGRRLIIIRTDVLLHPRPGFARLNSDGADTERAESRQLFSNVSFNPAQLVEKLSISLSTNSEPAHKRKGGLFRSIMGSTRSPDSGSRSQSPQRNATSEAPSPEQDSPRTSKQSPRKPALTLATPDPSVRTSFHEQRPNTDSSTSPYASVNPAKIGRNSTATPAGSFKFSLEPIDPRRPLPASLEPEPPRLPPPAQQVLELRRDSRLDLYAFIPRLNSVETSGIKYSGRALVEWMLAVSECQNFFERRRDEGVASDRLVETPVLGVESLRRPG